MGVGKPEDIVEAVFYGIDMFDCVLPTRNASNGQLITSYGVLNIRNAPSKAQMSPSILIVIARFARIIRKLI